MKERLNLKNKFDGNLIYGARNFNTKTGRDIHLSNRKNNVLHRYLSTKTGKLKKSLITTRNCPLCGNNNNIHLFNKSGFNHVKCIECEMIYVNPILNEEKLHNLYLDDLFQKYFYSQY